MGLGLRPRVVRACDLRVGNMIAVWWKPGCDIITELSPYTGPLTYLFPKDAQVATFATKATMTIDNADYYDVTRQNDHTGRDGRHNG